MVAMLASAVGGRDVASSGTLSVGCGGVFEGSTAVVAVGNGECVGLGVAVGDAAVGCAADGCAEGSSSGAQLLMIGARITAPPNRVN
jgi:hypothetical protein